MKKKLRKKIQLALAILLLLSGIICAMQKITASSDYANRDFLVFWLAGHANWSNLDPYTSADWIAARYRFGAETVPEPEFLYPLPLSVLLAPLGLLPLREAFFFWGVLSAILIFLSLYILILIKKNTPKIHYLAIPFLLFAPLYPPFLLTIYLGQLSAFLLFLASLATYFWHKNNLFWGGFFIAFFSLKPSIGLSLFLFTFLWLLHKKQYRAFIGIFTASFLLLGIGLLQDPHWVGRFLTISNNKMNQTFGYSPTLWGISGMACHFRTNCTVLFGTIGIIAVSALTLRLYLRKRPQNPALEFSVILALSLLTVPYLWPYDQLLLLIPLYFSLATLLRAQKSPVISLLAYLGVIFFAIGLGATANRLGHQHENLYAYLSLLVWGFSLWALGKESSSRA